MTLSTWLITGGCGFIGTNLIKALGRESGIGVRVVDSCVVGTPEDLGRVCDFKETDAPGPPPGPGEVELVRGDIRDPELALKAAKGMEAVVHLAANTGVAPSVEDPRQDCECNVVGILNYLEAARHAGSKAFVFASSGAPVGECEPPLHEEVPPHPVSPYGASKLAGEGYCSAYWRTYSLPTVALRFGNVYGPLSGHKSSVVAAFIRKALAGETCEIYGDGSQTRDFIYIDDLVEAVLLAVAKRPAGEVFQIATSREHTVNEVASMLSRLLGEAGVTMRTAHAAPRVGDVMRNFSDTSKAGSVLGWQARESLESGLKKTIDYFLRK